MGGDVGGGAPRGHDKKKKKKKGKKRRLNIRIDMTPMVDVAFLLLTFFMLTTTMKKPQTMEINIPPSNTNVEVAASNLLQLYIKEDGTIYTVLGFDAAPEKIAFSEVRAKLVQLSAQNPKLITLIKIDRKGKYSMMVDIMDELNLANITRFSIAKLEDKDKLMLDKLGS